jgi:subtilisin family serine protease
MFPAAFAPWSNGNGPVQPRTDCVPIISVGALNPDSRSTALFSNTGPWVRIYEPGGAVLSTMPPFQGGLMPMARTRAYGRVRESIDPDDFTRLVDDEGNPGHKRRSGGFALWSGTSFAAPIVAGKIACALLNTLPPTDAADPKADAVARGWEAVTAVAGITQ